MKTTINKIILLISIISVFTACGTDDMNYKDAEISEVERLYEPTDNKMVELESASTSYLYFSWSPVKVQDNGLIQYEILFDKQDGDFSSPIYRAVSDNKGLANYASISHIDLNKIASYAGVKPEGIANLKWTVAASRGLNQKVCKENRKITIQRLGGLTEVPSSLYLMGEGSEAGTNLSNALPFKKLSEGNFEIYTRLTKDKNYYLVDRNSGATNKYYITGEQVKEDGETTSEHEGIFRIRLDLNNGFVTEFSQIREVGLWMAASNRNIFNLDYDGRGIWKASGEYISFPLMDWGLDSRYHFRMKIVIEGQETEEGWGSQTKDNDPPTSGTLPSYYYVVKTPDLDQWAYCFKLAESYHESNVNVTLNFGGGLSNYTHEVIKVN